MGNFRRLYRKRCNNRKNSILTINQIINESNKKKVGTPQLAALGTERDQEKQKDFTGKDLGNEGKNLVISAGRKHKITGTDSEYPIWITLWCEGDSYYHTALKIAPDNWQPQGREWVEDVSFHKENGQYKYCWSVGWDAGYHSDGAGSRDDLPSSWLEKDWDYFLDCFYGSHFLQFYKKETMRKMTEVKSFFENSGCFGRK